MCRPKTLRYGLALSLLFLPLLPQAPWQGTQATELSPYFSVSSFIPRDGVHLIAFDHNLGLVNPSSELCSDLWKYLKIFERIV